MPLNEDLIRKLQERTIKDQFKNSKSGRRLPQAEPMFEEDRLQSVFHDDLARRLEESKANANLYFKQERGISNLNFYHDINSPEILSSMEITARPFEFSKLNEAEDSFIRRIKKVFYENYIKVSRAKEDKGQKLRSQVDPSFSSRENILNFYNSPLTTSSGETMNTVGLYESILDDFTQFAKSTKQSQIENKKNLQDTIDSKLEPIMSTILNQMNSSDATSDQFWSLLLTVRGLTLDYIDQNKKLLTSQDVFQFKTSIKTIMELFEQAILVQKFAALSSNPQSNIKEIYIQSKGSKRSKEFDLFVKSKGLEIATMEVAEEFIKERIENLLKKSTSAKARNISQITQNPSGGKKDTLDYKIVIVLKSGEIITDKVDAKFGATDKYSSSPIQSTFHNFLIDADTALGSEVATEFLQLIITFAILDAITMSNSRQPYIFLLLKYFIAYTGLLSTEFKEKFGLDDIENKSPNLVVIGGKYVWFSDFLKGFLIYFLDLQGFKNSSGDFSNSSIPSIRKLSEGKKESTSISKMKVQNVIPNFDKLINFINTNPSFNDLKNNNLFMEEVNKAILDIRVLSVVFYVKIVNVFSNMDF